jgi:hypothetical protein
MRRAAKRLTRPAPSAPKPRKRVRKGGDGKGGARFATQNLADNYLNLCHHPLKDLRRWLAEDKKRAGSIGRGNPSLTTKGGDHAAHSKGASALVATAERLRRQPLPEMRGGLDAYGSRRRGVDGVSARSRTGVGRYDRLRSLRGEADGLAPAERNTPDASGFAQGAPPDRSGGVAAEAVSCDAEAAAISAEFAAKIEGFRRRLRPWEISAAIRAAREDRDVALKGVRDRQQGERFAARAAMQQERAWVPPYARPS